MDFLDKIQVRERVTFYYIRKDEMGMTTGTRIDKSSRTVN